MAGRCAQCSIMAVALQFILALLPVLAAIDEHGSIETTVGFNGGAEILHPLAISTTHVPPGTSDSSQTQRNLSQKAPLELLKVLNDGSFSVQEGDPKQHPSVQNRSKVHQKRHKHSMVPLWLKEHINRLNVRKKSGVTSAQEDDIAAVFRNVAYGAKEDAILWKKSDHSGNRYERTTVLSETPDYNFIADENEPVLSGRRKMEKNESIPKYSKDSESSVLNIDDKEESRQIKASNVSEATEKSVSDNSANFSVSNSFISSDEDTDSPVEARTKDKSVIESILDFEMYDEEMFDLQGFYSDVFSDVSRRGDSLLANDTSSSDNGQIEKASARGIIGKSPVPRLSWFDYLLCTNRNMTWMFMNFLLGLLLLGVSVFAPYRMLSLRACTHILPRSHFVSVHLLIFIGISLKVLYMFHLAFGGKERLPLILILILTNTSIPCFISAYLILIVMMFLTADVQVYKPKFLTMHFISIFIVMMISLCFIADVIVSSAHSKSVLMLSRVMLIIVAVTVIAFYIRKYPRVIHVVHMLKREFQGELKLLVVPTKDAAQHKKMNIKFILRNRLHCWCRVMNFVTLCLGICCLTHFTHAVFLISSYVPAWVWWSIHASGAVTEAALGVLLCIAAAFTQRYNEDSSFISDLFSFSILSKSKRRSPSKERNGNVVYQRVSYSSGTESTQYTACPNEVSPTAVVVSSRSPKPPKRRTATVRRSATFSYAPQYPRAPGRPCQPPVPNLNIMRAGSTSQIPMYNLGSAPQVSDIYSPASLSNVPVYSPQSARSMLVHEDGFVRIRTQIDPRELHHRRGGAHGVHDGQHFYHGSNPQIHNTNIQQWNSYGSRDQFYHCLPRRRKPSRSSSFHQYSTRIPETDIYAIEPQRLGIDQMNAGGHLDHRPYDPNYPSISRRRHSSRELGFKPLNNAGNEMDELGINRNRRPSSRCSNSQYMNNLDRCEGDYGRRKLSYDDNNEPIYHNTSIESSQHERAVSRNSQYSKNSPMNVSDRNVAIPVSVSHHSGSPVIRHKISNISTSPARNLPSPSPVHGSPVRYSPATARREFLFPKAMPHRGSHSSLRSEDIPYMENYHRPNPLKRNHSSAGYFPSKYLQSHDASLPGDAHRYGSLRLGMVKKRPPGYVLHTNTSKLLNKYLDKYPKPASEETDTPYEENAYGVPQKIAHARSNEFGRASKEGTPSGEREGTPCDNSQSGANTSKGSDSDWALELITSSSILTDFYSLPRPKKKKRNKDNIVEEKEEEERAAEQEEIKKE